MNELALAALLCSKLCHDLVGPIGALNNGIEILADEEDPAMRAQAFELLGASAAEASRRLRFFRLAFGVAGSAGQRIAQGEIKGAVEGYFAASKVRLAWPVETPGAAPDLDKREAKLLLNLILLAAAALPRGGMLTLTEIGAAAGFEVAAEGPAARLPAEIQAALSGSLDEALLDTHNGVAAFAAALARDLGGRLVAGAGPESTIRLSFARE